MLFYFVRYDKMFIVSVDSMGIPLDFSKSILENVEQFKENREELVAKTNMLTLSILAGISTIKEVSEELVESSCY